MADVHSALQPLSLDTYMQTSLVDHGRQSMTITRPAPSHLSTSTPLAMPTASSSTSPVTSGPPTQRDEQAEAMSEPGACTIPIQDGWDLPQSGAITNESINSWIDQVKNAYIAGNNPDTLADSCCSMVSNAQLLCMGTMDLIKASLVTYSSECTNLVNLNKKLQDHLNRLKDEYALLMITCQEHSHRFNVEKESLIVKSLI